MIKQTMAALTVGLLAVAVAQPAKATEANLFEPFHNTHSARTFHEQREGGKRGTIWLGGEYRNSSIPRGFGDHDIDFEWFRGGLGYAEDRWQVGFSAGNLNTDVEGPFGGDDDEFVWDINAKWNFWRSRDGKADLAAVFNYRDFGNDVSRFDGLLAAQYRFHRDLTGVVNLGYGHIDYDFDDQGDFVGSIGLLWHPANWRRFTLGVDYTFANEADFLTGNAMDDYDNWSVKAGYFVTDNIQVTAGGGKRNLFFVGLNGRIN